MRPTDFDAGADDRRTHSRRTETAPLQSRTAVAGDGTLELTIFEAGRPAAERTTRWITAAEGDFVDLAASR